MDRRDLVRRVMPTDIKREYLDTMDITGLPDEARTGIEAWIDSEIRRLESTMRPGDQLFFYRYEKCCGWYREGYVAVRGECIVAEINTREDM